MSRPIEAAIMAMIPNANAIELDFDEALLELILL